jgi:two-component system sensor histidine kinase KdpD
VILINNRLAHFILNREPGKKIQFFLSISAIAIVSLVAFLFSGYVGPEAVAFILLITLSVIAMLFDIVPVLFAAVLSAVIWDYFFLLPRFNFRVGNTEDKIMLSMYFIIALINGVLTFKIRQIAKVARQKEEKEHTFTLYNTVLNSLSHEFRTPIATIIGSTDNLLTDNFILSEHDRKNLLLEISKASLQLNQQVENLLNMSRLESGFIQAKKDWCDINELIYNVTIRLEEDLRNFNVKIDCDKSLPLFKIDYGLMEQVIYNLVQNATRYAPSKSCIFISATEISDSLQVIVEDNGNGLPLEETQKVFEKFYRLNNSVTGGTGLGLSIVKGFVEAHKGSVHLENKLPHGAKFIIHIPSEKYCL